MAMNQNPEGPSPTIPIIVLIVVGMLLSFSTYLEVDPQYVQDAMQSIQTHFFLGALLIPLCVALIVQAVGIPQVNPPTSRISYSPLIESMMQDPATSFLLFVVIVGLLIAIPYHRYLHAPWAPPPGY